MDAVHPNRTKRKPHCDPV